MKLTFLPMNSVLQLDALRKKEIDVGFVYGEPAAVSSIKCHKIGEGKVAVALREDHALAQRQSIRIADLRERR